MTHSTLINGIQITSDSSPRPSRVDRFIVHHAATTSLAAILALFQPGGRTVSANYALGSDGTLILAVDEDRRAWTSASEHWDGRAVTIEVANSQAGGSWPVSDAAFDKLARLIADVSLRYGFPINDETILTHQELYRRYGDSYATACPGDLQRRKGELLGKANYYRTFGQEEEDMTPTQANQLENIYAAIFHGGKSMRDGGRSISQSLADIASGARPTIARSENSVATEIGASTKTVSKLQDDADTNTLVRALIERVDELTRRLDEKE